MRIWLVLLLAMGGCAAAPEPEAGPEVLDACESGGGNMSHADGDAGTTYLCTFTEQMTQACEAKGGSVVQIKGRTSYFSDYIAASCQGATG